MKLTKYVYCFVIFTGSLIHAAEYTVPTSTSTVDGDTFCGGSACTSADTIVIQGGARGDLTFQDFDGNGSYITIMNEDTNRVVITSDNTSLGVVDIRNCYYVDFRGDNKSGHSWYPGCTEDSCYGIKIIKSISSGLASILIYRDSDYIKIGYVEMDHTISQYFQDGDQGIKISLDGDGGLTDANGHEIHHNYIHNTQYCAIYGGCNDSGTGPDDNPQTANISIHDNLMTDLGSYGMNIKGIQDGSINYVYNNIIRNTGLNCGPEDRCYERSLAKCGISANTIFGTAYANIYNNWIENTAGPGIKITKSPSNIYGNTIVGCGTDDDARYDHGIYTMTWNSNTSGEPTMTIYDNIIVKPARYGISNRDGGTPAPNVELYRNVITEAGQGEYEDFYGNNNITEGTDSSNCGAAWGTLTDCTNIYEADTDTVCFTTWSDDSDYSNDDFTLCCAYPYAGDCGNTAPIVDAGTDQSITLPAGAALDGTVTDDGLPDPPASVTTTWTKQSGPGTVTFGNADAVDTTASFSVAGTYILRLTADDSDLQAGDDITITVNPDTTPPSKPTGLDIVE